MTVGVPGAGEFAVVGVVALLWAVVSLALGIGLIVLVVLGIRWLLRNTSAGTSLSGSNPRAEDGAMAALRERYARGEIDADEFEQRRRVLTGDAPGR